MRKKSANVDIDFWPEHYRYYGEPFNINPQSAILIVLCDNCDENHACNYQNCQIVLDYKNRIQTIFLMNDHLTNFIRVHCRQTLGVIYDIHLKIIFDNNVYINDMYFFTHVTHQESIDFTVKKFCIFTPYRNKITIEIYRNKNYKMLTNLASGLNFFVSVINLKTITFISLLILNMLFSLCRVANLIFNTIFYIKELCLFLCYT